jgi:hypothetical protein
MSRQQQLLHGNTSGIVRSQHETLPIRDGQEQPGTTKRTLMTKNAGTSEKRRRNVSNSAVPFIKREPQLELNDEVRHFFFLSKNKFMLKYLFRKIQKLLVLDVLVVLLKIQLVNVMDQVVS